MSGSSSYSSRSGSSSYSTPHSRSRVHRSKRDKDTLTWFTAKYMQIRFINGTGKFFQNLTFYQKQEYITCWAQRIVAQANKQKIPDPGIESFFDKIDHYYSQFDVKTQNAIDTAAFQDIKKLPTLQAFVRYYHQYFSKEGVRREIDDFALRSLPITTSQQLEDAITTTVQDHITSMMNSFKDKKPDWSRYSSFEALMSDIEPFYSMHVRKKLVFLDHHFSQLQRWSTKLVVRAYLQALLRDGTHGNTRAQVLKKYEFEKADLEPLREYYKENPTKTFNESFHKDLRPEPTEVQRNDKTEKYYTVEALRKEQALINAVLYDKDEETKKSNGYVGTQDGKEIWLGSRVPTSGRRLASNPYLV